MTRAKPPKPDEPQGLGAVVEDAADHRWTRIYPGVGEGEAWYCDDARGRAQWEHWANIAAVKVLSEGVQ